MYMLNTGNSYKQFYYTINVHSNWLLAFQTAVESFLLYHIKGWVDL